MECAKAAGMRDLTTRGCHLPPPRRSRPPGRSVPPGRFRQWTREPKAFQHSARTLGMQGALDYRCVAGRCAAGVILITYSRFIASWLKHGACAWAESVADLSTMGAPRQFPGPRAVMFAEGGGGGGGGVAAAIIGFPSNLSRACLATLEQHAERHCHDP